VHPGPGEPGLLAAAPQRLVPVPCHLVAEGVHRIVVAGHGVVGLVPAPHGGQPSSLVGDGQVPATPDLGFHLGKLGPDPFRVSFPPYPEPPAPGGRAEVREPQQCERLRLPLAPCAACWPLTATCCTCGWRRRTPRHTAWNTGSRPRRPMPGTPTWPGSRQCSSTQPGGAAGGGCPPARASHPCAGAWTWPARLPRWESRPRPALRVTPCPRAGNWSSSPSAAT